MNKEIENIKANNVKIDELLGTIATLYAQVEKLRCDNWEELEALEEAMEG